MSKHTRYLLAAVFCATTMADVHAQPRAGHSDYLTGLTRQALKQPFRTDTLPVLEVVVASGREETAKTVLALLATDADKPRTRSAATGLAPVTMQRQVEDKKVLTFAGERGYLDVIADGSAFRYRADIDATARTRGDVATRIGKAELEKLGRRFVTGPLARLVPLGRREALTFLGVRYLYEGDGSTEAEAGKAENTRVVASVAVFGRSIDGVAVVGSGSKVAVWFDQARQPVGFDVDWPKYQVSRQRQKLLPANEIQRRVAATTVAPKGEKDITVDRFECGFVDLGATRRDRHVQAGCSIAYRGTADGETWARLDFVPVATEVLRERRWPLATAIAAGNEVKVGSREYDRHVEKVEVPTDAPEDRPEARAD